MIATSGFCHHESTGTTITTEANGTAATSCCCDLDLVAIELVEIVKEFDEQALGEKKAEKRSRMLFEPWRFNRREQCRQRVQQRAAHRQVARKKKRF